MVDINSDNRIDFRAAVNFFAERKVCLQPQRLHIRLPNAKEVLDAGLLHFLGCNYMWQPEYDKVADWLTDNKGLGLFCMGNCGRGKTIICLQILPCIIQHYFHKVFSICLAREMNRHYTEVMRNHLLVIDDIGREEPYQEYGNRFNVFPDFVDDCERKGKFLITNTNCTKEQLAEKYGKDPLVWDKNVAEFIRLKNDPEYYNDPVCKHGYLRGSETFAYVSEIMKRYEYYQKKAK